METRQPDSPADGIDITLSAAIPIAQASMLLGMSPDGVRKRINKGTLEGYKDNHKWFVYLPDGTQTEHTAADNHQDKQTDSINSGYAQTEGYTVALAAMEARIASMETQLAAKDTQIGELHRLLAQTALSAAPGKPWWRFW